MSKETPYQLAELYDDFFVGNGMDDAKYIDGLIVQTNKGNVATLYARSTANGYGLSRKKLEQVVGAWNLEVDNPFSYSTKPLPQNLMEKLVGTRHKEADQLVTIMGVDLNALTREVRFAKSVLSAFGLRPMGPDDAEMETQYHITTQRLSTFVRKTAEETSVESSVGVSYLPASSKGSAKSSKSLEHRDEMSRTMENDDVLPVGAAREWLFMKAIAIAAGVPGQPNDCMNLYLETQDFKNPKNRFPSLWAVFEHTKAAETRSDTVNRILCDADKIRAFLTDKLSQMESRFDFMSTSRTWGTFLKKPSEEEKSKRDKVLFEDIAAATHALTVQASGSLSSSADNPEDDLFTRLQTLAKHCSAMGGIEWAAKDFRTLAYTANLLHIVERHAMFFQNETVRRIQDGNSVLPDEVLSMMQSAPIEIRHGYGQRIEGEMVEPGRLPAGFPGEFPCIKTDQGFVMVPGAQIETDPESGLSILTTPAVPDYPRWLQPERSQEDANLQGAGLSQGANPLPAAGPLQGASHDNNLAPSSTDLRALKAALNFIQTAYSNAADPSAGLSKMESFACRKRIQDIQDIRDRLDNPSHAEEAQYSINQMFDPTGIKIMTAGGLTPDFIANQKDQVDHLMEKVFNLNQSEDGFVFEDHAEEDARDGGESRGRSL